MKSFKGPVFPAGVTINAFVASEERPGAVAPRSFISDGKGYYHHQYTPQGQAVLDAIRSKEAEKAGGK